MTHQLSCQIFGLTTENELAPALLAATQLKVTTENKDQNPTVIFYIQYVCIHLYCSKSFTVTLTVVS